MAALIPMTDDVGNHLCYLGINRYGRYVDPVRRYVLGDSILRGLYVVYDLVNGEVGITTGDLHSESSDIEKRRSLTGYHEAPPHRHTRLMLPPAVILLQVVYQCF